MNSIAIQLTTITYLEKQDNKGYWYFYTKLSKFAMTTKLQKAHPFK